tara:strand:+ start:545 stop:781 length:237 start_codon:yes stop_codon:yes gene_type:complete
VSQTSWYSVCIASSNSKVAINKATDRQRQRQNSEYKYLLKTQGPAAASVIKTGCFNMNWQDAVTPKGLGKGLYKHSKK